MLITVVTVFTVILETKNVMNALVTIGKDLME